jgi:predicted O-methyltransferase YrrM
MDIAMVANTIRRSEYLRRSSAAPPDGDSLDPLRLIEPAHARQTLARLHRRAHRARGCLLLQTLSTVAAQEHEPALSALDLKLPYLRRATGALLYQLARAVDARLIVALGSCGGLAAVWLACALQGRSQRHGDRGLICIESDLRCALATRCAVRAARVCRYVDVCDGNPREALARIDDLVDFVFVDGRFDAALLCLKALCPRLRRGAVVFVHHVPPQPRCAGLRGYLHHAAQFASLALEHPPHCELAIKA